MKKETRSIAIRVNMYAQSCLRKSIRFSNHQRIISAHQRSISEKKNVLINI